MSITIPSLTQPGVDNSANARDVPRYGATAAELKNEGYNTTEIKNMKRTGKVQCETCSNRTYVDGSDDPGVSFKTPTKLNPAQAASAVIGHEHEHVNRNASKASQEGREVVESSVRIFSSVCPECGKSYVSGGETMTKTRKKQETHKFADDFFENSLGDKLPKKLDKTI